MQRYFEIHWAHPELLRFSNTTIKCSSKNQGHPLKKVFAFKVGCPWCLLHRVIILHHPLLYKRNYTTKMSHPLEAQSSQVRPSQVDVQHYN